MKTKLKVFRSAKSSVLIFSIQDHFGVLLGSFGDQLEGWDH